MNPKTQVTNCLILNEGTALAPAARCFVTNANLNWKKRSSWTEDGKDCGIGDRGVVPCVLASASVGLRLM